MSPSDFPVRLSVLEGLTVCREYDPIITVLFRGLGYFKAALGSTVVVVFVVSVVVVGV